MNTSENNPPKRPRGRPRKYAPGEKPPKKPMTSADRSALGVASWANRKPTYQRGRCIALRPGVYEALNERRGDRPWSEYLCDLAGIDAPKDGRFNKA